MYWKNANILLNILYIIDRVIPQALHNPKYFFIGYKFIHRYLSRNDTDVLGCSNFTLHSKVLPLLSGLANTYNEIFWDDRLNEYNHTPYFPTNVTEIVDIVPIYVQQPASKILQHQLYNPKYEDNVYKLQLGIDFLSRSILFTGPYFGIEYDSSIFNNIFL